MSITSIPLEITRHIFSFLELPELAKASQACKSWNILENSDLVWKPLFEKAFNRQIDSNAGSAKKQYNIEEIKRAFPEFLLEVFGGVEKFRKLPFIKVSSVPAFYADYKEELVSNPKMKILRVAVATQSHFLATGLKAKSEVWRQQFGNTFSLRVRYSRLVENRIEMTYHAGALNHSMSKIETGISAASILTQILNGKHPDCSLIEKN